MSILAEVSRIVDRDTDVRTVPVRAEGDHFSSGGNFALIEKMIADETTLERILNDLPSGMLASSGKWPVSCGD